jgi:hypothetical protein
VSREFEENLKRFRDYVAARCDLKVEIHTHSGGTFLQAQEKGRNTFRVLELRERPPPRGHIEIVLPVNRWTIKRIKSRENQAWLEWVETCHMWLEEFQEGGFVPYIKIFLALKTEEGASNQAIADTANNWIVDQLRDYVRKGESERDWLANPRSQLDKDEGYQIYGNWFLSEATTVMRVLKIPPDKANDYIRTGIENIREGNFPVFMRNTPVDADRIGNRLREWKQRFA